MVKVIGKIKCKKDHFSGDLILSTNDNDGNYKDYKINLDKFKNEAECILWTMVNNEMSKN